MRTITRITIMRVKPPRAAKMPILTDVGKDSRPELVVLLEFESLTDGLADVVSKSISLYEKDTLEVSEF
jgi:hypothetical protein